MSEILPTRDKHFEIALAAIAGGFSLSGIGFTLFSTNGSRTGLALATTALLIVVLAIGIGLKKRDKKPSVIEILTSKQDAKAAAENIYERAGKHGGQIYATHTFDDIPPDHDMVIRKDLGRHLEPGKTLEINRLLIVEDIDNESPWVTQLLELCNRNPGTSVKLSLPKTQSSPPPGAAFEQTPVANLLLYNSPQHQESLVSFRVSTKSNPVNPAESDSRALVIRSTRQEEYDRLRWLYKGIAPGQNMVEVRNHDEYRKLRPSRDIPTMIRAVEAKFRSIWAGRIPGLSKHDFAYIGLFGSSARYGGQAKTQNEPGDSDIDLLVVYEHHSNTQPQADVESSIMHRLQDLFPSRLYNIAWGSNPVRYAFRERGKTNIDIELLPRDSRFLAQNLMLGLSICRWAVPIWPTEIGRLDDAVFMPSPAPTDSMRWRDLVLGRGGLSSLCDQLSDPVSGNETDPRRVMSHGSRNLCWAILGTHLESSDHAIEFIRSDIRACAWRCAEFDWCADHIHSTFDRNTTESNHYSQAVSRVLNNWIEQITANHNLTSELS